MRRSLLLALAVLPGVVQAAPIEVKYTGPKAKAPSACGAKFIPLAEGNEWTYTPIAPPQPPDPRLARLIPTEPKEIVVTVKSIAKQGADTVISLEEKVTTDFTKDPKKPVIDVRTVESTITCNAKGKFEVSPDSIFFAGEPGGYYNLTLDKFDRSRDTSWKLQKGAVNDRPWREDVSAHWTRNATPGSDAKLGSGTLELERSFTPEQPEVVISKLGGMMADKVALVTTGRVGMDGAPPDQKPTELPANWISTFWFANGVGLVQVLNTYGHMYQLADAKLK